MALASSAEKDAAVAAAIKDGVHNLSDNQLFALKEAASNMTDTGRAARNLLNGKKPGESDRNFLGL